MIKILLISFLFILAVTFFTVLDGLVLFAYWEWFLIPLGVVRINFYYAIAFAALLKHFTCDYQAALRSEDAFGKAFDYLIFKPMLTFGLGYIVYFLMKSI